MISFESSGSTKNTENALTRLKNLDIAPILNAAGQRGVSALSSATPKDSGRAASSWDYVIKKTQKSISIIWTNSDFENGFPVAVMLQYGHATGTGGYVSGQDYINPAMRPVMDQIAADVWRAVTNG